MRLRLLEQILRLVQLAVRRFFQLVIVVDNLLPFFCRLLVNRNDNIILLCDGIIACGKFCLSILELLLQLLQFGFGLCDLFLNRLQRFSSLSSSFTLSNMLSLLFHPDKTVIS